MILTDLSAYEQLTLQTSKRWVTSQIEWISNVDSHSGRPEYVVIHNELDGYVLGASFTDDGEYLVVGVSDPAGIMSSDISTPASQYAAALELSEYLHQQATQRGRKAVLIKNSALFISGIRGIEPSISLAFDEQGYSVVRRSFYAVESDVGIDPLRNVSSRVKTQINSASQLFYGADTDSDAEIRQVVDLYSQHSKLRGGHCPFTAVSLGRLMGQELKIASARLYYAKENKQAIGFSISIHEGSSAEVFTWGSLDPSATSKNLTKFIVADTIKSLSSSGYLTIEYGCRFDGTEYGGLTEFYRRLGGSEIPGVWMHKETQ